MKKAKIVLSAVALLAVVGGALAFKAKYQPPTAFTYTTTAVGQPSVCTTIPYVTANNGATPVTSITYYTTSSCAATFTGNLYPVLPG